MDRGKGNTPARRTMDTEFVEDYTTCQNLRNTVNRSSRLLYGAANIASNGHPNKSGAVDHDTLCGVRPQHPTCGPSPRSAGASTLAESQHQVRRAHLMSQMQTFRSFERRREDERMRREKLAEARCESLMRNTCS